MPARGRVSHGSILSGNLAPARVTSQRKSTLDYAERGAIALPAEERGSVGGFDSPFEEAVAAQLERRGWMVVPQVGISGFRIDLGVRHPDLAGAYLAGVECDGATYHGSATARDRDKVREQVLKGLGWDILRVWSTDWWFDAKGCAERLHESLEALLRHSREQRAMEEAEAETHWDMGHEVEGIEEIRDENLSPAIEVAPPPMADETELVSSSGLSVPDVPAISLTSALAAEPTPAGNSAYRVTNLSTFKAEPDLFYEFAYRDTLRRMIEAVMVQESPLKADILAQRVARAHGWLQTGRRIRERIDLHLRGYDTTSESSGVFLWKKGDVSDILPYRPPANENSRRSISDIPLAELASMAIDNPDLLDMPDPARDLARLIGVERLAATSRARLDEAIARARLHMV